MRRVLLCLFTATCVFFIYFFAFSFINWSFNIGEWNSWIRFIFAILVVYQWSHLDKWIEDFFGK